MNSNERNTHDEASDETGTRLKSYLFVLVAVGIAVAAVVANGIGGAPGGAPPSGAPGPSATGPTLPSIPQTPFPTGLPGSNPLPSPVPTGTLQKADKVANKALDAADQGVGVVGDAVDAAAGVMQGLIGTPNQQQTQP